MAAFRESKVRLAPGRLLAAALIAGLLALSAPAGVRPASEQEQAREHYKKGLAAYNLGQYSEAAAEFEAAYRLFLDPALLFNIAQAHRMNGEMEKALGGYRAFLRTAPPGTRNRAQAEKWGQELEREVARAKAAAPATPAPRWRPSRPRQRRLPGRAAGRRACNADAAPAAAEAATSPAPRRWRWPRPTLARPRRCRRSRRRPRRDRMNRKSRATCGSGASWEAPSSPA